MKMNSINKIAKLAGILYFLVILAGVSNEILVRNFLFISGDITATVNNILTHEFIFRLGFVISLIRQVVLLSLVLVLYKLLKPVNSDIALVMVAFALVQVSIGMVSLLFQFTAPLLLSTGGYSTVFTTDQWYAQTQFFIDLQVQGDVVSQLLSVWLLPLGYLVYKSGFFPKILGVLLMIACLGYLADFLIFFLLPNLDLRVASFAFLAEVVFPFWLLIKGVNVKWWESRALRPPLKPAE
jgi:hypothetical protein